MAIKTIDDSNLTAIADAIRAKNGSTNTYKPSEMAAAIAAITTGGGSNITQWGKIYYDSSHSKTNLSSIVADYSKIDFMIFLRDNSSNNTIYIYFPGLTTTNTKAAGYLPLLQVVPGTSSGSAYGSASKFISPNDYASKDVYYFKESEFNANGDMYFYYSSSGGTMEGKLSFPSTTSVLVFYHE